MMEQTVAAVGGEGVNVPAVAAPEEQNETREDVPSGEKQSAGQSPAENAKYAAARRRAEEQMEKLRRQSEQERADERQRNEALRGELAAERARTLDERARIVADEQVREIGRMDGTIGSMDDLLAMPEYEAFYELVKKGNSLVEKAAAQSARQAARSVASRQHMSALAGGAGTGEYLSVPAEVAAQYRLSKPGITDAEIRRKYRKYKNYQRQ